MLQQSLIFGAQLEDHLGRWPQHLCLKAISVGLGITLLFLSNPLVKGQHLNPGEVVVGVQVINHGDEGTEYIYTIFKGDYDNSAAAKYAQEFAKFDKFLKKDQDALNAQDKNLHANVELLDSYAKLTEDERAEFLKKLGGIFAGKILDGVATLNPWNVNNAVKSLKEFGVDSKEAEDLLRFIANQKDKRAIIESIDRLHDSTGARLDAVNDPETRNKVLYNVLAALYLAQGNPELGVWITGADVAQSFCYLGVMGGWKNTLPFVTNDNKSGVVNRIAENTDLELVTLTDLAKKTKSDFDNRMKAEKAWQAETGNYGVTPIWPPRTN